MKTIGLIGGMSWESTTEYYRLINRETALRLGGLHSAKIIVFSVDFAEIEPLQRSGDWNNLGDVMVAAGSALRTAGADILLICSNTMHSVYDRVAVETGSTVIHIADAAGEAIRNTSLVENPQHETPVVGLLGTRYTMESSFYTSRLHESYGIDTLIPDETDRRTVNSVIYEELCKGAINDRSRREFDRIIERLRNRGAQAVILGCTEIPLLIQEAACGIPLFDTTELHAKAAVTAAID